MPKIRDRAIHAKRKWRKVANHNSLDRAMNGKDGIPGLFAGTLRIDWKEYGAALGALVWEDYASSGFAFRRDPDVQGKVQRVEVAADVLLSADRTGGIDDDAFAALFEGCLFPDELADTGGAHEGAKKRS